MTVPSIVDRNLPYVSGFFRNDPNVSKYKIVGHKELMGAFTAPVDMFEVRRGQHYKSPTVLKNPQGCQDESRRGLTKFLFSLRDFNDADLPAPDEFLFIRVQEYSIAADAYLDAGPILVVPNPEFFGVGTPTMTLYAEAPGISAVAGENPPADALAVALPTYTDGASLKNVSAADDLLFSLGESMPMSQWSPEDAPFYSQGAAPVFYIASANGNTVPVSFLFAVKP